MIWIILLLLVALVGAYLMQPFFAREAGSVPAKLEEARAQRAMIDQDEAGGRLTEAAAQQAKDALDRRILALLDAPAEEAAASQLKSIVLYLVPATLLLGGVAIYAQVGSPAYEPITVAEYQAQQTAEMPQTLEDLVVELRATLEADPNPPFEGYILLARSHLRLGDAPSALAAYERAVELSDGDENVIAERDRVVEFIENPPVAPQIDPDAAAAIQSMTPDEQAAMIEGMVSGLAQRLEQDPRDMEGWLRLIRARLVMGDLDQARLDLETAQSTFADDPAQLARLDSLAAELSNIE